MNPQPHQLCRTESPSAAGSEAARPHAMVCRSPRWTHAIVCDACNRVGPSYPGMQPRALREPDSWLAPETFSHFRFVLIRHAGISSTAAGVSKADPVLRRWQHEP